MRVGVPREIKNHEYRVALVPDAVRELTQHGHQVLIESGAGDGSGHNDEVYAAAGARIVPDAAAVFDEAELIVKVKEPQASEWSRLSAGQTLFTFLHLAPDRAQTDGLINSGATCIAYETVTDPGGRLPLLAPMSEVAGRMSVQAGAMCLERSHGGRGILLGGVAGTRQARVVILGGGVVGRNAAQMAIGLGASVTILDRSLDVLRALEQAWGNRLQTLYATSEAVTREVMAADLVIGAVLIPGAAAPRLVTAEMVDGMTPGTVLVDVAIDQGGCFATSRPTTHAAPTYLVNDVVHYCVSNMPGAVPRTSAAALNNATLPFVLALADKGVSAALRDDACLRAGMNVHAGKVTNASVAAAHDLAFHDAATLL